MLHCFYQYFEQCLPEGSKRMFYHDYLDDNFTFLDVL